MEVTTVKQNEVGEAGEDLQFFKEHPEDFRKS